MHIIAIINLVNEKVLNGGKILKQFNFLNNY